MMIMVSVKLLTYLLISSDIGNKAIVDSRRCPQSCCHLANGIEMQEMVDCKLDANNE